MCLCVINRAYNYFLSWWIDINFIFLISQQLLISSRNLEFFTNGYRYLIQILPAAVVAPMYFSGKIEFGVINQSVSAFNHILGDFSLIVYQFQAISAFSAIINRLGTALMHLSQFNFWESHERYMSKSEFRFYRTEELTIFYHSLWFCLHICP